MIKYRYDYWMVYLPSDLSDSEEEMFQYAIREAASRSRFYRTLAWWTVTRVGTHGDFNIYKVRRKSRKDNKKTLLEEMKQGLKRWDNERKNKTDVDSGKTT